MIPWFHYTVVYVGPIPIQVWGFFVALGMLVSVLLIDRYAHRQQLPAPALLDGALYLIVGGLIGARLVHVFLYEPRYFLAHPFDIIAIWTGGMSSFGGLLGAILAGVWVYKQKMARIMSVYRLADIYASAALFGWLIGRVGCVLIHDHPGRPCDGGALCVLFPDTPRYDMALLEIIGLLPLVLVFLLFPKKRPASGTYVGVLLVYYGLLRSVLDFWRATDVRYIGLTPGQYFGIMTAIAGVYLLVRSKTHVDGRFA